jgi:hypothetical protein
MSRYSLVECVAWNTLHLLAHWPVKGGSSEL